MPTTLANPGDSIAQMRFKEPYVSQGLNKKLFGLVGAGVVRGGKLQTTGAGFGINIVPDSIEGDSIYSYQDVNDLQFTVRQEGTVALDLTANAGTTVYVCLYVGYTIGATTVVEWRSYTDAELFTAPVAEAAFVIILGRVVVPGVGPIPAANVTPIARRVAWDDRAPGGWHQIAKNGSFERAVGAGFSSFFGIEHWMGTGFGTPNYRISTTAPYSGTREFQLEQPAPGVVNERLLSQTAKVPVVAGQYVRARVRLRGNVWAGVAGGGHQGVALKFYTNEGVLVSTVWIENNALSGTFGYTLVDGTVAVPATAVWMRLHVGIHNNGAVLNAGSLYFDDVKCWVESDHPIEDVFDQNYLGDTRAFEVLSVGPGDFDTPAPVTMDEYVDRTIQLLKFGQIAGPPVLERLAFLARTLAPFQLSLVAGQLQSGGFSAAQYDIARLMTEWTSSGGVAVLYTLIWEIGDSSPTVNKIRFYARHGQIAGPAEAGDLNITINARWDGVDWNKDDTTRKAFRIRMNAQEDVTGTTGGISFFYVNESTNTWLDADWQQTMNFGSGGSELEDAAITFTVPSGFGGALMTAMSGNVTGQGDFHILQRISDGALVISHNADFDPVGALWNYDVGTGASRIVLVDDIVRIEKFTGAGPTWAEAAWVTDFEFGTHATAGPFMFVRSAGADLVTDPFGPNRLFADMIPKFWATVLISPAGTAALTSGMNVASVAVLGSGLLRITFNESVSAFGGYAGCAMTPAYAVTPEFISTTTSASGRVDVAIYDATGALVDLNGATRAITIVGLGHQT